MKTFAFFLGRLAYGGFFLYNGINHFRNRQMMSQYAGSKNVPSPEAAIAVSGAMLLFGGASVITGIKPTLGAASIATFLGVVSPQIHNFWMQDEPGQRMNETIHFSKNMALLGAAVAFMGIEEPWPISIG
jgi:uncharacterized membrane protein YphA (DoxX/SURF4 family)